MKYNDYTIINIVFENKEKEVMVKINNFFSIKANNLEYYEINSTLNNNSLLVKDIFDDNSQINIYLKDPNDYNFLNVYKLLKGDLIDITMLETFCNKIIRIDGRIDGKIDDNIMKDDATLDHSGEQIKDLVNKSIKSKKNNLYIHIYIKINKILGFNSQNPQINKDIINFINEFTGKPKNVSLKNIDHYLVNKEYYDFNQDKDDFFYGNFLPAFDELTKLMKPEFLNELFPQFNEEKTKFDKFINGLSTEINDKRKIEEIKNYFCYYFPLYKTIGDLSQILYCNHFSKEEKNINDINIFFSFDKIAGFISSLFNEITLDENPENPLLPIKLLTLEKNIKSTPAAVPSIDLDAPRPDIPIPTLQPPPPPPSLPPTPPERGSSKRTLDSTLSPEKYKNIKIEIVKELINVLNEDNPKNIENYNSNDEKAQKKAVPLVKKKLEEILNGYLKPRRGQKPEIDENIKQQLFNEIISMKPLEIPQDMDTNFGKYGFDYRKNLIKLANKYNIPISKNISVKKLKEKLKNFYNLSRKYNIKLNKSTYNNLYKLFKLQELSKKFNINITKKYKNKRVYKSIDELKKEIKSKLSKIKEITKKFNINITKKYKDKRVYKSINELKKEIKSKLSKK